MTSCSKISTLSPEPCKDLTNNEHHLAGFHLKNGDRFIFFAIFKKIFTLPLIFTPLKFRISEGVLHQER